MNEGKIIFVLCIRSALHIKYVANIYGKCIN